MEESSVEFEVIGTTRLVIGSALSMGAVRPTRRLTRYWWESRKITTLFQ
jgi:hypothetical protein